MDTHNEDAPGAHRLSDPATWVDRYGDSLFRYACFRLRDAAFAQDVVQETFLAALHARSAFGGHATEKTWLMGILKNKIIDCIRKKAREVALEDQASSSDELDAFFDARGEWASGPAAWDKPDQALENSEFWKILAECLDRLPARQAYAFSLCELDELSGETACKLLEITPTNLWVMLHRARLRLRQCLEDNWFNAVPE